MKSLRKYWSLLKISWETGLVYRVNILLWRFRQFLLTLMSLTLWTVIFGSADEVFSYTNAQMITYIFVASVAQSIILATALNGLARTVYTGELSNVLVKPVSVYLYLAAQDVADKLKNFGFIIFESLGLYLIFQPPLVIPSAAIATLFVLWLIGGAVLNFLITLLFGAIGFWSPDIWGPRFLFFMIVSFTAGNLYPLDILPEVLTRVLFLTPFPYFAYMQSQLFLGRIDSSETLLHSAVLAF